MTNSADIQTLLKSANLEIRQYISELEAENLRLQKQIAKLQVKDISSKNRITALEQEIKKHERYSSKITTIKRIIVDPKNKDI